MKSLFLLLALFLAAENHAASANQIGEKKDVNLSVDTKLKAIISKKSIQNVLKTVEILKEQKEALYRQKKNNAPKNQPI